MTSRPIVFIRALLVALGLLLAALPAAVLVGAFAPSTPTVGRFGGLVNVDLPWLLLEAAGGAVAGLLALRLGAGRAVAALAAAPILVALGLVTVFVVLMAFAAQQGASYSILRQTQDPGAPPQADEVRTFATVEGSDLRAAIWHPGGAAASAGGGATGLVFIHGGAFIGGGLGSRNWFFQNLAGMGIGVVDIEYRLSPPERWNDAPADVLCALGWVRANAADLGIDAAKVFVMGESAGGNLALVGGYAAGSNVIAPSCPGEPVRPAGVIALAPTADLVGIWDDKSIQAENLPFPEVYTGGTPAEVPDHYDAAEPFRLLRPGLPPTLLVGGANDHFVLPPRVTSLYDRFTEAGVDCQLVMVPFAEHGFDGYPNSFASQLDETLVPRFIHAVVG